MSAKPLPAALRVEGHLPHEIKNVIQNTLRLHLMWAKRSICESLHGCHATPRAVARVPVRGATRAREASPFAGATSPTLAEAVREVDEVTKPRVGQAVVDEAAPERRLRTRPSGAGRVSGARDCGHLPRRQSQKPSRSGLSSSADASPFATTIATSEGRRAMDRTLMRSHGNGFNTRLNRRFRV